MFFLWLWWRGFLSSWALLCRVRSALCAAPIGLCCVSFMFPMHVTGRGVFPFSSGLFTVGFVLLCVLFRVFFLVSFPPTQSLVSPVVGVSAFLVRYVGLCCVSFGFSLRVISRGLFPPSPLAPHYGVCCTIRSVSDVFLSGVWVCDLRIVILVLESYCDVFCVVWFRSVLGADCSFRLSCCVPPGSSVLLTVELFPPNPVVGVSSGWCLGVSCPVCWSLLC